MVAGQRTVELRLDLSSREVLRQMGSAYGQAVPRDVLALVNRLLGESVAWLQVRGLYVVRPVVSLSDSSLELEGCGPFRGPIAGFLRPARRVAVFVVTVGSGIDREASRRQCAGLQAEGHVLHAIGSAAADAACDALVEHLWAYETARGEAVTAPFSPGYCGMPLEDQRTLFSVLDTRAIGVALLPSMMMRPMKSVSGLAGIGQAEAVEAYGLPCEHCPIAQCGLRRQASN